jgi:hypothetical protein
MVVILPNMLCMFRILTTFKILVVMYVMMWLMMMFVMIPIVASWQIYVSQLAYRALVRLKTQLEQDLAQSARVLLDERLSDV